ncbi:hypothetical protein LMG7141_03446 [Ralstonia condita]|uniref:Uncharacterized protein n=1 Tax=Ralstonia condita TaxID=3058600 RepID=A0ABM9JLS6_9RALS|nr:hypothetical protein [Ralstonia sp. LMG 7141]CAJ0797888.1 hypothetical protein LMG7141_03446 [Ralstonia sp. LMG 7141]
MDAACNVPAFGPGTFGLTGQTAIDSVQSDMDKAEVGQPIAPEWDR